MKQTQSQPQSPFVLARHKRNDSASTSSSFGDAKPIGKTRGEMEPVAITTDVGTYLVLSKGYYFTTFRWRNHLGHPKSVTRQQVVLAFDTVWERYHRLQRCHDGFGWWWLRSVEDAREVRKVRAKLGERVRGLYWTVATMQRQLDFLAHCERTCRIPLSWDWTPHDLALDMFPITAPASAMPTKVYGYGRLGASFALSRTATANGESGKMTRHNGKHKHQSPASTSTVTAASASASASPSGSITDFTFRVTEYVNRYGEPPTDKRTAELAAMALELAARLRENVPGFLRGMLVED